MGRYNEFSDDVVNALSSGALKVVEALEIEDPTGTWWRLIQAKDETTARVFLNRRLPGPVIAGGQILLTNKTADLPAAGQLYNSNTRQPVVNMAFYGENMTPYYFVVYHERGTHNVFVGVVFDQDGNVVHNISPFGSYSVYTLNGAFLDHANQRILVSYKYSNETRTAVASLFGASFAYAGSSYYGTDAGYHWPKVFPEDPYKIYTLFTQDDAPKIKVVTSTEGASAHSTAYATTSVSGATAVTVAAGYRKYQADIAYSRAHKSVMLIWIDDATGDLYYALESEGWATAHLMVPGAAAGGLALESAGNLVLTDAGENSGEYYVINWRKQQDGTLGVPGGFSYPTNLKWIGATPGDANTFRLFGSVGSDWYIYQVDYDTMTITKATSAYYVGFDPIFDPGSYHVYYQPTKLGEDQTRELYAVQVMGGPRTKVASREAILICYNKETGEIVWSWGGQGEWQDATIWPLTYADVGKFWFNHKCHHILRIADRVLLMQKRDNEQCEHYAIPITSLLACDTVSDVNDALIASGIHTTNPVDAIMEDPYTVYPWCTPLWGPMAATWGEALDRYVFALFYSRHYNDRGYRRCRFFYLDKTTWDLVAITDDIILPTAYGNAYGATKYDAETRTYRINFGNADPALDPWMRVYSSSANAMALAEDGTTQCSASLYGDQMARIIPLNQYGQSLFVSFSGTTVYISGVDFSASPAYSFSQRRFTLPFTPDIRATLVSEFEDKLVFFSPVTDGVVYYTAINALEGDYEPGWAINASDYNDIYTIALGQPVYGGAHAYRAFGSWLFVQDVVGNIQAVQTGAPLDAYLGGGTRGQQSEAQSILYEYQTAQYIPYPWEREGIRLEVSKLSKTCKVALPDTPDSTIRNMLLSNDFRGCRCIIRRLFLDADLQNGAQDLPLLDGFIQDWGYSTERGAVLFSVSRPLIDITSTFPRRIMNMGCSHVFKGKRCQYTGGDTQCSKTWEDCVAKGNEQHFGGFPWVAVRQRKVMWK